MEKNIMQEYEQLLGGSSIESPLSVEEKDAFIKTRCLEIFIEIMFDINFFSQGQYEKYYYTPERLQEDFIDKYKKITNVKIYKNQVTGIVRFLIGENSLLSVIESSKKNSLTGFIKALPDNILEKAQGPYREDHFDHRQDYYDFSSDLSLEMIEYLYSPQRGDQKRRIKIDDMGSMSISL